MRSLPSPTMTNEHGGECVAHSGDGFAKLQLCMDHWQLCADPWHRAMDYLFGLIFDEKLEAWGVMTEPHQRFERERIPHIMFDRPNLGWRQNVIKKHGRCYVSVRVKLPGLEIESRPFEKITQKPVGRPRVGEQLRAVVRELKTLGKLKDRSKKEKTFAVRDRARERHPQLFRKPTQPSDQKISEALDAEGE